MLLYYLFQELCQNGNLWIIEIKYMKDSQFHNNLCQIVESLHYLILAKPDPILFFNHLKVC